MKVPFQNCQKMEELLTGTWTVRFLSAWALSAIWVCRCLQFPFTLPPFLTSVTDSKIPCSRCLSIVDWFAMLIAKWNIIVMPSIYDYEQITAGTSCKLQLDSWTVVTNYACSVKGIFWFPDTAMIVTRCRYFQLIIVTSSQITKRSFAHSLIESPLTEDNSHVMRDDRATPEKAYGAFSSISSTVSADYQTTLIEFSVQSTDSITRTGIYSTVYKWKGKQLILYCWQLSKMTINGYLFTHKPGNLSLHAFLCW